MKVQEAIKKINEEPIYSIFMADDVIDGEVVKRYQDLDTHRWYSTAVRIYKVEDGYVGVWGPFQLFSEVMSWKDLNIPCAASEVFPEPSTYYSFKKRNGQ